MFQNFKTSNLAKGQLFAGINAAATTLTLKSGNGGLFPSSFPFLLKIEKYDTSSNLENKPVLKREIVKVVSGSGDVYTIERSAGFCPSSDTATTQTNTAFAFDANDFVFLTETAENDKDIKDELMAKAYDADVVHKTGNETISGIKTFSSSPIIPAPINDSQAAPKSYVDSAVLIAQETTVLKSSDYIAGEAISQGDSLFLEKPTTFADASNKQNIGDVIGNTRVSFPFIGSGVASTSLKLGLCKTGAPSTNLIIRLEKDDAGSPSGTLLDPNATATITAGSLTTSLVDTTVALTGTTTSNGHGVLLNNTEASQTMYKGVKITLTSQVSCVSITKDNECTATTAYIYDEAGNLLTSATFFGLTATLNYPGLVNGSSYYIVAGSGGSTYTSVKQTGSAIYPYVSSKISYVEGANVNLVSDAPDFQSNNGGQLDVSFTITPNKNCLLVKARGLTRHPNSVLRLGGSVVATGLKVGDDFTYGYLLTSGVTYTIEFTGSSYTPTSSGYYWATHTTINNIEFGANLTFLPFDGIDTEDIVSDVDVNNITSISTSDTVLTALGTKYHVVLAQTSDTVNGSNYFNVGYSTKDTTTRGMKLWDGTWGGSITNKRGYISSVLATELLLSRTDADFSYKLPDIIRLANEAHSIGQVVKYDFAGISKILNGLSKDSIYYVSNTPGALSTVNGTYTFPIGYAINSGGLKIQSIRGVNTNTFFDQTRGSTAGSTDGTVYLADNNYTFEMLVSLSYSGSGGGCGYAISFSKDNSTWYPIYANSIGGNGGSAVYQHTLEVIKGCYYKTTIYGSVNSVGGTNTIILDKLRVNY